ncbi:histidine--tRNA ligase [Armatimonas sp.]|uniref:histidine--tRNA ligase n=1 Tax=Armatimonas sp. TaxID=1872638 RepID=UPI00286A438F|nr:histidine--tRNA ligase [Armatimonas sp.]
MRYAPPKGTYDILPPAPGRDAVQNSALWQWLETSFREICRQYGYSEIRTPIFESHDLIHRSVGEGTDIVAKETFDFITKGNDALTLRPEGTAGVMRAFVSNRLYIERPVTKLYYIGPNFRYERPQKGRYRQHHQAGAELLGASGPEADAEVIALACGFYARLGLTDLKVKLNTVGTPESRAEYVKALRTWAEPLLPQMSGENNRRFAQNALRMLDSKEPQDIALLATAPSLSDYLDEASQTHFAAVKGYLTAMGLPYEEDPRLVRGFDYYTHTVFEIQSVVLGDKALGGGGRYNGLIEAVGGPATPGIGFGLGLERVLLALEETGISLPTASGLDAFLCPLGEAARASCVTLLAHLRAEGVVCDMDYTGRRMKAMLEQADQCKARFAVILGDDELAQGVATVRDMITKVQEVAPLESLSRLLM